MSSLVASLRERGFDAYDTGDGVLATFPRSGANLAHMRGTDIAVETVRGGVVHVSQGGRRLATFYGQPDTRILTLVDVLLEDLERTAP